MSKLISFLISTLLLATACQTSPTGRKQLMIIPDSQLDAMGAQAFADMKTKEPVQMDPRTNAYVKCIATAITDILPEKREWEVVVFKNPQANAFALPGGKIGVYEGMIKTAQTPDQLAAVLGHEVAHVLAKHSAERLSSQFAAQGGLQVIGAVLSTPSDPKYKLIMGALGLGAQFGVLMPWGRAQETEADVMGVDFMARAGFDPTQSVELWRNMEKAGGAQPPEILSSHPSHGTRIETLQSKMSEAVATYQGTSKRPGCKL